MKPEVSLFWLCFIRHSFHIDIADSVFILYFFRYY